MDKDTDKPNPETEQPSALENPESAQERGQIDENSEEFVDEGPTLFDKAKELFNRSISFYKNNLKRNLIVSGVLLLVIIFAIPISRYTVLGLVIKKDLLVQIVDSQTNIPVSEVEVMLGDIKQTTDGEGKTVFKKTPLGYKDIQASKKYYKNQNQTVALALSSNNGAYQIELEPVGRQVPVRVINKITGKPLEGAIIEASGTKSQTDPRGETTLVLPADEARTEGQIILDGYNQLNTDILVSKVAIKQNTFELVPHGRIAFLKQTLAGIDVVGANLDGSGSSVILESSGLEREDSTLLAPSHDWRYLVLRSYRSNQGLKLYVIDTHNENKLTEIDGDGAYVSPLGWVDHKFVYVVNKDHLPDWTPKRSTIKVYNAESGQLDIIDTTKANGSSVADFTAENLSKIDLVGNSVVYGKYWTSGYNAGEELNKLQNGIWQTNVGSLSANQLRGFEAGPENYISLNPAGFNDAYFRVYNDGSEFFVLQNDQLSQATQLNEESFNQPSTPYLFSPTASNTFWFEQDNGNLELYIGDSSANNGVVIHENGNYKPHGWFSDHYILIYKNKDLFVMPSNGLGSTGQIIKIGEFFQSREGFYSYGGI